MRQRALVTLFIIAGPLVMAAAASAQTGAFVGGAVGTAGWWFQHEQSRSPTASDDDPSGSALEWFVSGGGVVARHAVIQAELSVGSDVTKDIPPPRSPTGPPPNQIEKVTHRFRGAAVLAGYTTGSAGRVNVTALAGVAFIQTRRTIYEAYTPPTPPPYPIYPLDYTDVVYSIAPEFGLDVPITAGRHLVVVPQVRTYKIPVGGPLSVSVAAGARIIF